MYAIPDPSFSLSVSVYLAFLYSVITHIGSSLKARLKHKFLSLQLLGRVSLKWFQTVGIKQIHEKHLKCPQKVCKIGSKDNVSEEEGQKL